MTRKEEKELKANIARMGEWLAEYPYFVYVPPATAKYVPTGRADSGEVELEEMPACEKTDEDIRE